MTVKRIAAVQSNYIPWKGYFDIVRRVDEFYLYDCVQYTPRNWRNRNCIKSMHGLKWLTIPVIHESRNQRICEKIIADSQWNVQHWKALCHAYAKAPYFKDYKETLETCYVTCVDQRLSDINLRFIAMINNMLGITTPLKLLTDHEITGDKNGDLIRLCQKVNAQIYLTGPTTRGYIDEPRFNAAGISIEWMEYNYQEYPQLYSPFEHHVTILDTIFNIGFSTAEFR